MTLHHELFKDLPPAEKLQKMFAGAFAEERNADGYYILVQYIAEKYGERAYEIAEQVFKEMGMAFDPAALRTPDLVRRVGYNFEGINIYNIHFEPYRPEMDQELVRLYNQQLRLLGKTALLDVEYFHKCIAGKADGLLVACNEGGQLVGFCHCLVEGAQGSVEALVFSTGRIYDPVRKALVKAARDLFASRGVNSHALLTGKVAYPFYQGAPGQALAAVEQALPHIYQGLMEISAG